ncbi:MAG: radical SAM family heme chaperone HemW [Bdellovibrionota bacterium]
MIINKAFALYVHLPFCLSKCKYCDFYSVVSSSIPKKEYFDALEKEASFQSKQDTWKDRSIQSIYFGGGTPSLIEPSFYKKFLDVLKDNFNLEKDIEITLEANPKTLSKESLLGYLSLNVNRISLGVQSFNDKILKFLGRTHTAKDAVESVNTIKEAGFKNINLDLIYGVPFETLVDVQNNLKEIIKLDVPHISFYSLIIEPKTAFGKMKEKKEIFECDDETFLKMDKEICDVLENDNFCRYEISGYAKNKSMCKHNLAYWNSDDFLGLGANAYSGFTKYEKDKCRKDKCRKDECKKDKVAGSVRCANLRSFSKYIDFVKNNNFKELVSFYEENDLKTTKFEYIMMGLRKVDTGISFKDFFEKFGVDFKETYQKVLLNLEKENLIDISSNGIKIKKDKILISNSIIEEFL